jgi:hypothetical protein
LRKAGSWLCAAHDKASKPKNGHKFNAQPTTIEDIRFDSKAEAKRWQELRLLEKAGQIRNLTRQPVFPLHAAPVQRTDLPARLTASDLSLVLVGVAKMDFAYEEAPDWEVVTEDVKGFDNALSRWKRKHVLLEYGVRVILTK